MGKQADYFLGVGPAGFETAVLDIKDFDGTELATFENDPARGIYGVSEAYCAAIEETFADDADAIKRYEEDGEHQNRTPLEIVESLVPSDYPTPRLKLLTSQLVAAKLSILESQIGRSLADGTPWPRPLPGFIEYSQTTSQARRDGIRIDRAILSAGHESFIRKCYEMLGIEPPDILIDNETMQELHSVLPSTELAKPSLLPFVLIKMQWLNLYGVANLVNSNDPSVNERITVVGDSVEKDGGLACNAGVDFVHITKDNSAAGWNSLLQKHQLMGSVALGRQPV